MLKACVLWTVSAQQSEQLVSLRICGPYAAYVICPPPLLLNPIDAEHNCCRLLGAYAGTRGNWSMIGSPRMFKFSCRTWQSMKSMSGSNWPLFCTADSFTNLADMSGCDAGTAFEPSTSAGDQCSNRPCVPFAKRWSCTVEIIMRPSTHRQVLRGQLSRNIRKCASHRKITTTNLVHSQIAGKHYPHLVRLVEHLLRFKRAMEIAGNVK